MYNIVVSIFRNAGNCIRKLDKLHEYIDAWGAILPQNTRVLIRNPLTLNLWWTPHPVIVTIRDNKDYIRVLLYS